MATVSSEEMRMAMDFFGVDADTVLAMSDEKVARGLEQYYGLGKQGEYDASPPLPSALDWISEGLQQSTTLEGIEFGFRETGKAVATTARQVGTGIQKGAASLLEAVKEPLGEAADIMKLALVAVVVVGVGYLAFKLA